MHAKASLIVAIVVSVATLLIHVPVEAADFASFQEEVARFKAAYSCPLEIMTPPEKSWSGGSLFGCYAGKTKKFVKYYIDAIPKSSKVERVTVMWDDWFDDILGYGLHADEAEAQLMVKTAARLYAPSKESELLIAFRAKKNQTIKSNGFSFEYTYYRGPRIDDRQIAITKE
jgi:hypothetical protein